MISTIISRTGSNGLRWNTHVDKLTRPLDFFVETHTYSCPQDVKEAAYKELVRPIMEYGRSGIVMHILRPPGGLFQE